MKEREERQKFGRETVMEKGRTEESKRNKKQKEIKKEVKMKSRK